MTIYMIVSKITAATKLIVTHIAYDMIKGREGDILVYK